MRTVQAFTPRPSGDGWKTKSARRLPRRVNMRAPELPHGLPMKVLFVCLGNICRSPTAEGVLRALAGREHPRLVLEVDSAGTADFHVGEPPDRRTIAAARRRGYDLAPLRARQVCKQDFMHYDYVLAMDRANLAELTRLRGSGAHAHVGLFLEYAAGVDSDEVPDPYHAGIEAFERVLDLCERGARGLLASLERGESPKTTGPADSSPAGPVRDPD